MSRKNEGNVRAPQALSFREVQAADVFHIIRVQSEEVRVEL